MTRKALFPLLLLVFQSLLAWSNPDQAVPQDSATFDPDGTAHIRRTIPMPRTISPEAQKWLASLAAAAPAANAEGCIKGAVVGGVAGHFVGKGHGLLGAGAGCAIGHHEANKQAHEQQPQDTTAGSGSSSH